MKLDFRVGDDAYLFTWVEVLDAEGRDLAKILGIVAIDVPAQRITLCVRENDGAYLAAMTGGKIRPILASVELAFVVRIKPDAPRHVVTELLKRSGIDGRGLADHFPPP